MTDIVQQIADAHAAEIAPHKGPPSRPLTTRVLLPYIALVDAYAESLGKTRSVVVAEFLTKALDESVKALPRNAALTFSALAQRNFLKAMIQEMGTSESPEDFHIGEYFNGELEHWDAWEKFDPDVHHHDDLGAQRPHAYFDQFVVPRKD